MAAVPTVRQRQLAAELRRLREELGPTADEIATRLDWSPSKLSRIETARIGVRISDVRLLLELYQVDEIHRGEVLALAQAATKQGWWAAHQQGLSERFAAFIALEDEASAALSYATYSVPGLLQTKEYAHCTMETSRVITTDTPREVARRVDIRMRRQQLLRKAEPLEFSAVVDESVLLRLVGGREIMWRQMQRLMELAQLPNVDIRILPLDVHREPVIGESFTLLKFASVPDIPFPDIAYIDNFSMAAAEFQDDGITDMYGRAWEVLRSVCPSAEESVLRISSIARERWQGQEGRA
ncbi:helix-turn-helix domain-containing protein [Spirillospora sp. CA-142024]|uniref:helix-turn-helix domain-containing protein n=1 Tax=Spirillospora sp. CA-142024 TaxID=3240036 RepID=UPI003D936FE6